MQLLYIKSLYFLGLRCLCTWRVQRILHPVPSLLPVRSLSSLLPEPYLQLLLPRFCTCQARRSSLLVTSLFHLGASNVWFLHISPLTCQLFGCGNFFSCLFVQIWAAKWTNHEVLNFRPVRKFWPTRRTDQKTDETKQQTDMMFHREVRGHFEKGQKVFLLMIVWWTTNCLFCIKFTMSVWFCILYTDLQSKWKLV